MQCEAFQERLNEVLDKRRLPSSDSGLTCHAARCPCCAEILRISNRIVHAMEQPRGECAPKLALIPHRSSSSTNSNVPSNSLLGVIAVAVTLLIIASFRFGSSNVEPALSDTPIETTAQTDEVVSDLPAASFVYQPIIGLSLLSRADWTHTINEFELPFSAQASYVEASWLQAVSAGMMPVQQSVNDTFELIRRSVSQAVVSG